MSEKYRLFLDQMFKVDVAQKLRDQDYDVLRVSEVGQDRADDQEILQKSIDGNRILITLDEHFGDWVVLPLSKHPGVIRMKVHPTTSKKVLDLLVPFLRMHTQDQFKDHLVILSEKRVKWIHTK
jgi:predicted nuclease of predicted toxin-antitoxin system